MDDQTLIAANRIFLRFATDIDAKIRYGQRQRQTLKEALARGETPKGYRVDFINRTARDLFKFLADRALEFNIAYPQDRMNTDDFADILLTAMKLLQSKISGKR